MQSSHQLHHVFRVSLDKEVCDTLVPTSCLDILRNQVYSELPPHASKARLVDRSI